MNYQTADGSATAGTHYLAASGTLSFPPGQTTQTVSVTVKTDTAQFTDTSFSLNLSAVSGGAFLQRGSGSGFIQANAGPPGISIVGTAVTKPASGTVSEAFTVTLSSASPNTVAVNYGTSPGSAAAGTDYMTANGTVTFAPGFTTQTINVTVTGNTNAGSDLYYNMFLAGATNAVLFSSQAYGFIQNPNHNPTLSINVVSIYKAVSGTATAKLTVTLSSPSPNTVSVNFATSPGSATAGLDYTTATGILTFTPGITSQSISVATAGNTTPTGDKYFFVYLSAPVNATIVSSQGLVDIIDSSIKPYMSVTAAAVQKPSTGTANAVFTVTLSPASPNTVSATYATSNGSATAPQDYTAASGNVTFPSGTTSQTINVVVTASTIHTGDLYFYMSLSAPVNAIIGQSYNFGTIIDPTFKPNLTVDDTGVLKPTSGTATETFTVHLDPASPNTVMVNYQTGDGSAVAGVDYLQTSGTLTFAPGDTTMPVHVTVNGSASSVPDRYMTLNIGTPVNAQILTRASAYGYIVDQVTPTTGISRFTVQDAGILKPDSGTATETFNINLFPAASTPVNVNYATGDVNAIAGMGDYVAARGTLTFAPGITTQSVSVTVNGNTMSTADKYFSMNLSSNTNPPTSIFRTTSYGSILNKQPDNRSWVGPDITINRGTSGSTVVNFSVNISSPQQFPIQLDYTTNDGSATAPDGYVPEQGTLFFAAGQTTQTVGVTVPGNAIYTGVQYFSFSVSSPVNTSVAWATETNYIYNLDVFDITGKVTDTTGAGLAGVTVTRSGNFQPAVQATTAGDGTFVIHNNIDGVYTVKPTLASTAFLPTSMSATVRGAAVATLPFIGYTGTGITGQAVDSSGKALAAVTITLSGAGAGSVTTNTAGFYAFGNVAPGTGYVVTPTKATFSFNPASYTFNVASTTVMNQDFVALQGVIISGQVTHLGIADPGVTLTRTGGGGQPTVTTKTNSQGYYGFSNNFATVAGVTYTITPSKTGQLFTPTSAPATVTTTSNATGVDFTQN
jgi:hypothetical protein